MESNWLDKTDVVERQLQVAISLYFEERDPVAIHTLIAAAHQILFDLGKLKKVETIVKNTKALEGVEIREFITAINYPYNFFKHADSDKKHVDTHNSGKQANQSGDFAK